MMEGNWKGNRKGKAHVIILDPHTIGIQCFEYFVNFELNDSIINFSFSSSKPKRKVK